MDRAHFWSLIDAARNAGGSTSAALERALAELPRADIASFDAWFWAYLGALDRQDVWAAAYLVHRGCSDDAFTYFRAWLIGEGEHAVLAAVRDPDSLERLERDESMLSVASRAYERAFGEELPSGGERVERPDTDWPPDRLPRGAKWTRAFLAEHYPRLWEKHGWPAPPTGTITRARFWELITEARARRTAPTASAVVDALKTLLLEQPVSERIGALRWIGAYNQALIREDLRAVSRVVLGDEDLSTALGFRGWLLTQGEAIIEAAVRDPDSLATLAHDPIERCDALIHFDAFGTVDAHVSHGEEEPLEIPAAAEWPADWTEHVRGAYTPELLRARFPRLTATRSDDALRGPADPSMLPSYVRQERADGLLGDAARRSERGEHAAALALLDQAVQLSPSTKTLGQRARAKLALGDVDGALRDLDEAIERNPRAAAALLDRAKIKHSHGDHAGAMADAERSATLDHAPARTWLTLHRAVSAAPTRARHAKFGEGTIVSIDGTGDQQKVTIDFSVGRKTLLARFVELLE